jgi:hypothetical protein
VISHSDDLEVTGGEVDCGLETNKGHGCLSIVMICIDITGDLYDLLLSKIHYTNFYVRLHGFESNKGHGCLSKHIHIHVY